MNIRADHLPLVHKRSGCRKCGCVDGHLARYIQTNGRTACRWVCSLCGDYFTAADLPLAWVRSIGVELDELVICRDRRGEADEFYDWRTCAVCGETASERHHWAPRSIFPDWPYELTVLLCRTHHNEWHSTLREHGLRYPHELQQPLFDLVDAEPRSIFDPDPTLPF